MATILLLGSDKKNQENLASALRAKGHSILVADNCRISFTDWSARISSAEIAVFDVTRLDDDGKRQLRSVCQQPWRDGVPVLVLCYSRAYHGPRFELDIERLGARFVYAE
jgi:DNA-binding response OmpR family regulator